MTKTITFATPKNSCPNYYYQHFNKPPNEEDFMFPYSSIVL